MICHPERYAESVILAEMVINLYRISSRRGMQKHDMPSREVCRTYDFSRDGHQVVWNF